MFRSLCAKSLIVFVLVAATTAARAELAPPQPFGVFAKVDVPSTIKQNCNDPFTIHVCLREIYLTVLANKAISGLTIGLDWSSLSQTKKTRGQDGLDAYSFGGYDWSLLDDAFAVAGPQGAPVQLILTPGFASPQWVTAHLAPCDGLFTSKGYAPPDCGSLQFKKYSGQSHTSGKTILPLPWPSSKTYESWYLDQWTQFLGDLKRHVQQSGYAASLVAIGVAGPTSASSEIIMPTTAKGAELQANPNLPVDDAWNKVIVNALGTVFTQDEQNTDQPFVDAFTQTFQAYLTTFPGPALILSPDGGDELPEYNLTAVTPESDLAALFEYVCANFYSKGPYAVSCYAKVRILASFAAAHSESNLQAIQVGGMSASSPLMQGDIGVPAVKCFATPSCLQPLLQPLQLNAPPSFLGGAEFDFAATTGSDPLQQQLGCPTYSKTGQYPCGDLSPELIAFNVFAVFFDRTQGEDAKYIRIVKREIWDADHLSPRYNQYTSGSLGIQYVDVSYNDVIYAGRKCPPKWNKYIHWTSMQDVLNHANYNLRKINGIHNFNPPPPPTCPNGPG